MFVDADDFLAEDANGIFDENKEVDADIIFFRHKAVIQGNHQVISDRVSYYNEIIDEYFESYEEWKLRVRPFIPWAKFVRRSLVEKYNIRFDETKYSNDCYFSTYSGIKAEKILVRNDIFYILTESKNSLTSSFCTKPGELECRVEVFFRVVSLVNENNYPIDKDQAYNYLCRLISKDKKLFIQYSHQMIEMGISKRELVRECFKTNKLSSRIKRSLYAYITI